MGRSPWLEHTAILGNAIATQEPLCQLGSGLRMMGCLIPLALNSANGMDLNLARKTVLVAAASRGLGYATARQFAREGANVALCARSAQADVAAAQIAAETDAKVIAIRGDVSQLADVERVVSTTVETFGRTDFLVERGLRENFSLFSKTGKRWSCAGC